MDKASCGEAQSCLLLLPQELLAAIVDGLPRASRASLAAASKLLRSNIYSSTRRLRVTLPAEPTRCSQLDNGNSDAATIEAVSQLLPLLPRLGLLVITRAAQVERHSAADGSPGQTLGPFPVSTPLGTGHASAAGGKHEGQPWASAGDVAAATDTAASASHAWEQLACALDGMVAARLERHTPGTISSLDTCRLVVSVNALPGILPPSPPNTSDSFTTERQQHHQQHQGQQEVAHAYAWLRHLQQGRPYFRASLTATPASPSFANSMGTAADATRVFPTRELPAGCSTWLPPLHAPVCVGISSVPIPASPPPLILHTAAPALSPHQAAQRQHPRSAPVEVLQGLTCLQALALKLAATPSSSPRRLSDRPSPPPSPPQPPATPPAQSQRAVPWSGSPSTATSPTSPNAAPETTTPGPTTTRPRRYASTHPSNPHRSTHSHVSLPQPQPQLLELPLAVTHGGRASPSCLTPCLWWPYLLPHMPHLSTLHLELPTHVVFWAKAAEALAAAAPSLVCLVLGGDVPPPEALRGLSSLSRLHTLDLRPAAAAQPSSVATAVPRPHVFTPYHAAACAALPGLRHISVQHLGVVEASDTSSGCSRSSSSNFYSAEPSSTGGGPLEQPHWQQHQGSRHPASAAPAPSGITSLQLRGCVLGAGRSPHPPLGLLFPLLTHLTLHKLPSLPQTWRILLGGSSSSGSNSNSSGLIHLQQLVLLDPWPLAQELRLMGDVLAGTYRCAAAEGGAGPAVVGRQGDTAAAGLRPRGRGLEEGWAGAGGGGGCSTRPVAPTLQRLHVGGLRDEGTAVAAVEAAARLWPCAAASGGDAAAALMRSPAVLSLAFYGLSDASGWRHEEDSTALPPLARALVCCCLTGLVVGVDGACGEEDQQLHQQQQSHALLGRTGCGAWGGVPCDSGHGGCGACCGGGGGGGGLGCSSGLCSMVLESLVAALPYMGHELWEVELHGFGSLGVCDARRVIMAVAALGKGRAACDIKGGAQRCGSSPAAEASGGQEGEPGRIAVRGARGGVGLGQGRGVARRVLRLVRCGCRVCGPCGAHGVGALRAQGALFGLAREHGVQLELVG